MKETHINLICSQPPHEDYYRQNAAHETQYAFIITRVYGAFLIVLCAAFVTGNAMKLSEVRAILGAHNIEVESQDLDGTRRCHTPNHLCLDLVWCVQSLSCKAPRKRSQRRSADALQRSSRDLASPKTPLYASKH